MFIRKISFALLIRAVVASLFAVPACVAPSPTSEASDELATRARLEVYVLDGWGRAVPLDDSTKLTITWAGSAPQLLAVPRAQVVLEGVREFTLSAASRDFLPVSVKLRYDGQRKPSSLVKLQENAETSAVVTSVSTEASAQGDVAVYHVYVGMPHRFFATSGPAYTFGNRVSLFADGEQIYANLYEDLQRAQRAVHLSTWWWESDFELVRPEREHIAMSPAQRNENTILRVLERSPAHKRVLIGQFFNQDGTFANLTSDAGIERWAAQGNDRFEMMGEANATRGVFTFFAPQTSFLQRVLQVWPVSGQAFGDDDWQTVPLPTRLVDLNAWPIRLPVPHASMHQKFVVIDDAVAYVGGANLRKNDWDTSAHAVHEPRRSTFDTPAWQRQAIARGEFMSNVGPRKDYAVRVQGPAVADVADVFAQRWARQMVRGVRFSDKATRFVSAPPPASLNPGVRVQITTTMPAPDGQNAIAESWINAVRQASNYIYIEDQYFRAPALTSEIAARMAAVPGLQLVVITKPVAKATDPGCEWTHRTVENLTTQFGSRVHLFTLRSHGLQFYQPTEQEQVLWGWADSMKARFEDIDVHSKMFIVDDRFMSIGSANKNNRGMLFEAEMNVAIYDAPFVTAARRRILSNLLGPTVAAPNDVAGWLRALHAQAAWNESVVTRWRQRDDLYPLRTVVAPNLQPVGFVYPLTFGSPNQCLLRGVGPDMT